MLLFGEEVEILYSSFVLLLHDGSGAFCEYSQFLDDFDVDFETAGSLEGVTGSVIVA